VVDSSEIRAGRGLTKFTAGLLTVGVLLLSTTAAAALAEWLVRLLAPQQLLIKRPDIWMAVDTLGWVHRPNISTTINTGERTVRVVTDSNGFRVGRDVRSPSKKRILLLGDSFMEAFQVEYEQSLAGLLEVRLPARIGTSVAVVNTGVGGWDPPQYWLQGRALLRRRAFDLVLVSLYLGNDVVLRRPDRFAPRAPTEVHHPRFPRRLGFAELTDAVLYPINDYLVVRSHLFVLLKTRLHTLLMRLHLTGVYFPEVLLRREATSRRWNVTADICRDIAALGQRNDVPTLFVLVPSPYEVDPAAFAQFLRGFGIDSAQVDLDQPGRLMREALERRQLRVVDALPALRAAQNAGPPLYGSIDNHLSPAGHDALEHLIEPEVAALLSAARRGTSQRDSNVRRLPVSSRKRSRLEPAPHFTAIAIPSEAKKIDDDGQPGRRAASR